MAKNITIREGDTSKQFTAKKLKVNLVGGGTANFIPEDEVADYVDLKDHEFKENGTFNPSDFNCDGFGQVKVSIPSNVKEKTFTKNGAFNASADNVVGYSKVTIAVPAGGGGGPYTVRFFGDDRQTILKTDTTVPYGGSASCSALDGTVVNGEYFKGWNPSPTNVKGDMNCYPLRGEYVIDYTDIQDSWETICENHGVGYPLGAHKVLNLVGIVIPQSTHQNGEGTITVASGTCNVAQEFVKVAEGESGSHSTWISSAGFCAVEQTQDLQLFPYANNVRTNWKTSFFKNWLNDTFFNVLPTFLKENIVEVTKVTQIGNGGQYMDMESLHKIWIPSNKELETWITPILSNPQGRYGPDTTRIETQGIDYSVVYVPDMSGSCAYHTRTECRIAYYGGNMSSFGAFQGGTPWYQAEQGGQLYSTNPYQSWQFGFCL